MSKLKFGTQLIGDELIYIRPFPKRLTKGDWPLLGSEIGLVQDDSPNWVWQIVAQVFVEETSIVALDEYIVTLKQYLDDAGMCDLLVRNDADTATEMTYPDCRFDELEPDIPSKPPLANCAKIILTFTSASDPSA